MTVQGGRAPSHSPFGKPENQRHTLWLFLGPCVTYLALFSIYPLIHSLRLSFTDLTAASGTGKFVGLENYRTLLVDPLFWNAAKNSAIMVTTAVFLEVVLSTALALFFNLHLTGSWIVRGIMVLPMLITPIVVGVMWRALLNPDWGLVNWIIAQFGLDPPNWLGSIGTAMKTLIMVDVWDWAFRELKVAGLLGKVDCPCCVRREFEWLTGAMGSHTTTLCGRNAVQVAVRRPEPLDFGELAARLNGIGEVRYNAYMLRFTAEKHEFTVFPDGRAIIKGTHDIAKARTLYAQYVGS